jgi:hypothetical protein
MANELTDEHPNHENHMCHLVASRQMQTAAKLAKDAKFICLICGRAAAEGSNLCKPVEIE